MQRFVIDEDMPRSTAAALVSIALRDSEAIREDSNGLVACEVSRAPIQEPHCLLLLDVWKPEKIFRIPYDTGKKGCRLCPMLLALCCLLHADF